MNAFALLTAAVLLHVTWNILARHEPKEAVPLWWVLISQIVFTGLPALGSLFSVVTWTPSLFLLLGLSATGLCCYLVGLSCAYSHAPVALVYPVVRSSPLLIALWSLLFFQEVLSRGAWTGMGISVAGLGVIALSSKKRGDIRALFWCLFAMTGTSIYSLSDKAAVASLPSLSAVMGFLTLGNAAALAALTVVQKKQTGRWIPQKRISLRAFIMGGPAMGGAYAFTISAMRELPAAVVVAFTNAGIALAVFLSVFVFKENTSWKKRCLGAVLICTGIIILSVFR
jgi:phosphonate utilization associated putative membrane protein